MSTDNTMKIHFVKTKRYLVSQCNSKLSLQYSPFRGHRLWHFCSEPVVLDVFYVLLYVHTVETLRHLASHLNCWISTRVPVR